MYSLPRTSGHRRGQRRDGCCDGMRAYLLLGVSGRIGKGASFPSCLGGSADPAAGMPIMQAEYTDGAADSCI